MKLKPILPTLKEKKRYLTFEIIADRQFSVDDVSDAVQKSALSFLGTLETGKAGFMFLKDKYSNNTGVVKAGHRYVDKARTALALIQSVDNHDAIFRTRIISGTLKKSLSKFQALRAEV